MTALIQPVVAEEAFPPAGGNIVLLSGLAGDVESEGAYREQMRARVGIAARSKPNKLLYAKWYDN
jgi:hypothetical protein